MQSKGFREAVAALLFVVGLMAAFDSVRSAPVAMSPVLSSYKVESSDPKVMQAVADKFEIHHRLGKGFEVIVPANQSAELLKLVPTSQLLERDIKEVFHRMDRAAPDWRAAYHTFSEVKEIVENYAAMNFHIARLQSYGTSAKNRPLMALKLSDNVQQDEDEPEILITAATHGDELITVEVILAIMDKIIQGYATDSRIREIVDRHEIYFIPVVNPDGFSNQDRYDNGSDPNRSYPWPESQGSPTPSINPLIQFFHSRNFVASIDFHASGQLLMYPWAWSSKTVSQTALPNFQEVTRKMAALNGYEAGQISHILYVAKGSSADYYHWKNNSISLGIEMATSKVPPPSQIPAVVRENMESTLLFIEHF